MPARAYHIPPPSKQTLLPQAAEVCLRQDRAPSAVQDLLAPSSEQGTHWFCAEPTRLHQSLLNHAKAELVTWAG